LADSTDVVGGVAEAQPVQEGDQQLGQRSRCSNLAKAGNLGGGSISEDLLSGFGKPAMLT
jgi:hypothetical protein